MIIRGTSESVMQSVSQLGFVKAKQPQTNSIIFARERCVNIYTDLRRLMTPIYYKWSSNPTVGKLVRLNVSVLSQKRTTDFGVVYRTLHVFYIIPIHKRYFLLPRRIVRATNHYFTYGGAKEKETKGNGWIMR